MRLESNKSVSMTFLIKKIQLGLNYELKRKWFVLFVLLFFVLFCLQMFVLLLFSFALLCFVLFWLFAALKIQKQSCWIQPHQPCQRGFHWLHGAIFLAHFKNGAKWRWVGVNARIRSNWYHAPFCRKSRDRPVLLFQSPWYAPWCAHIWARDRGSPRKMADPCKERI